MKCLKIAFGLAVVAGLMAVVAAPAMAVPRWVHCVKAATTGGGQWNNDDCLGANGSNEYETKLLVGTSEVTSSGNLELEDTNATGGAVTLKCTGKDLGWVANLTGNVAGEDGVSSITNIECKFVNSKHGSCEESKGATARPRNLPWGSRLVEIAGKEEVRDELISGSNKEVSNGEPGWSVECTVGGILKVTDTCERSGNTQDVRNNRANLVTEFVFDARSEEAKERATCSIGGKETGRVGGTIIEKLRLGNSLWVLASNLSEFP